MSALPSNGLTATLAAAAIITILIYLYILDDRQYPADSPKYKILMVGTCLLGGLLFTGLFESGSVGQILGLTLAVGTLFFLLLNAVIYIADMFD